MRERLRSTLRAGSIFAWIPLVAGTPSAGLGLAAWGAEIMAVSPAFLTACQTGVGRAAVSLRIAREKNTPKDASVFIDEEFIGPLTYVAAHGVRLPVGEHRITIEKAGYFPWDRIVVADRQPIQLDVRLEPIPD